MEKADALIVLGGEPLARPQEAARLYRQGVARKVFVTGIGDAARIAKCSWPPACQFRHHDGTKGHIDFYQCDAAQADARSCRSAYGSDHHLSLSYKKGAGNISEGHSRHFFWCHRASIDWWKREEGRVM